jgi:DNA-directed RNA polymerase subunit RPC12/RpoP
MEQNQKKWPTIKCPNCGYEFTPAEIFYPETLLGNPESVVRDALGKIIYLDYTEGEEPCQPEKYFCDNCDKPFIVEPVLTFKVKKEVEELDFTETFVSLLD